MTTLVSSTARNIRQRLNGMVARLTHVAKDGYNTHQQYEFVSAAGLYLPVRKAAVAEGVSITIGAAVGADGNPIPPVFRPVGKMMAALVCYALRFTNTDEPSDYVEVLVWIEAADSGDKALAKAMTYAMKQGLLTNLLVSPGNDAEAADVDEQLAAYEREQAEAAQRLEVLRNRTKAAAAQWAQSRGLEFSTVAAQCQAFLAELGYAGALDDEQQAELSAHLDLLALKPKAKPMSDEQRQLLDAMASQ